MKVDAILKKLQSLGNERMKVLNARNGAGPNQYGVKMGDIRKVGKKVKSADKNLAIELWNTQIIEAQHLATLLLNPEELSTEELDHLVTSISFERVADWFNSYIVNKHPQKDRLLESWMQSDNKWALRAAWSILASKIAKDDGKMDLENILDQIEAEMPRVPQEVQWTMNFALGHIGIYHPAHRQRAISIGNTLGIYKDYPVSKGCTSPFVPIWIEEMVKRQNQTK